MLVWFILIGLVLVVLVMAARSIHRDRQLRKKIKELMPDDQPPEFQKTSTFGSFFFWTAGGILTSALFFLIIGEFGIFWVLVLIASVLWNIGFWHDRPKMRKFYEEGKQ